MDWLLWVVLGALFIGAMPILVVSAVCLIALIAERAEEKREERRRHEKGDGTMNRLINEDDVIQRLETVYGLRGEVKSEALQAVDACQTVDAEHVVRCCECRYAKIGYTYGKPAWAECIRECNYGTGKILPLDWFCAGGVKFPE